MKQNTFMFSVFIVVSYFAVLSNSESGGTEGFYYSPNHLGHSGDLQNLLPKLKATAQPTKYTDGQNVYSITNITTQLYLNIGKQVATIQQLSQIHIHGATLEFLCNFNWTTNSSGKLEAGYGYASVFSDSISYAKQFANNSANFLIFKLVPTVTPNIKITNNFQIKRIQPYTPDHLKVITHLFNDDTSTAPSSIKTQLAKTINVNLTNQLEDVLNHEIFGQDYNYSYYDPSYGYRQMQLKHEVSPHVIDPLDGMIITFKTSIANFPSSQCAQTVPLHPFSRQLYGGHQTIHSFCFYETVAKYYHSRGWLNATLGSSWQSNYFQFFAGDLYDVIPSLIDKLPAKTYLYGHCTPGPQIKLLDGKQQAFNTFEVQLNYSCYIYAYTAGTYKNLTVFDMFARYFIEPSSLETTLQFTVDKVIIEKVKFQQISEFPITKLDLAQFKLQKTVQKMIGHTVFGTGFPAPDRIIPTTVVKDGAFVLYYDGAYIEPAVSQK